MPIKISSSNAVIFHGEMTVSAFFRNDLPALRSKQLMHLLQIGVRVPIPINIKLGNFEAGDCLITIAVKRLIQSL
jgi:hypothetical protein